MSDAPRTFVDVSELLTSGLQTGIQRVGRQIIANGRQVAGEFHTEIVPVVAIGAQFHPLNEPGLVALFGPSAPAARLTPDAGAIRLVKAALGLVPPIYDLVQERHFRARLGGRLAGLYTTTAVDVAHGDRVVLLDSFWGGSTALGAAAAVRATGADVIAVIYDMIPVTHPEFCGRRLARSFPRAFAEAMAICTGVITISRYCADVIAAHAGGLPVGYFYLGADLGPATVADAGSWPELRGGDGRLHVMVGTIEPRKGHAAVLSGFERRWAAGHTDRLLIIGKIGWGVEAFMARCTAHPELGRRLFLAHNCGDAALQAAFDLADAAIMASAVEGFGLPVVEALHRGIPVIASDIPVFREIAGDEAQFFRLGDAADLARAIGELAAHDAARRTSARAFSWIDWRESTRHFLGAVDDVAGRRAA